MAKRSNGGSGRRRVGRALTATALGGLVAAAVVRSRQEPGWATGEDPCGPDGLALPDGTTSTVTTDDGAELEVLVAGPAGGPTVVLPHCWTGVKEFWAPVARRLVADGHRVVLYDQRGHGRSTIGTGPMSTDRLGDDLLEVLDAAGGRDLVLCGHSMGGMTVQALAVNHPDVVRERVRGIVLVATAAQAVPRPLPAFAVHAALGDGATRRLASRTALSRGAVGKAAHRAHVTATHEAFAGTAGAVRAGFLVGMSHMDYRKGLASVGVPTRILVGTHDRLTPVGRAKVMARAIPGADLTVLPGMGHMLPLEAPAEIVAAIESLEDVAAATA
jgi:pimeloyl-ACP methyl ester carboxylesterase